MTSKPKLSRGASELLETVKHRYLDSQDFNGLHIATQRNSAEEVTSAIELAKAGLVEVIGESDYINIHIRPWPSKRSVAVQVQELRSLSDDDYGVCLYPTTSAMESVELPKRFEDSPFGRAMARGRSTLEIAFFSSDILESYRNDARFQFNMSDFGVSFVLSDEAYDDPDQPEKDQVMLLHLGFGYDMRQFDPKTPGSPIIRRVAAFYGDLKDLTPQHQQRWASFQVDADGVDPHPVWYASKMGTFPDGIGPFTRLTQELKYINDLFQNVWGVNLFRVNALPEDFGWILRADQREWDHFIHSFDKLLSDNIDASALDAAAAPLVNSNGDRVGTLGRLELFMTINRVSPDIAKQILRPLREVRSARQKPAHALRANLTDLTYVRKQMELLHDVNEALINLRDWLSTHPRNRKWHEEWPDAKDYSI